MALVLAIFAPPSLADDTDKSAVYGNHYGYLFEVTEERNKRDLEMVMLEQPKAPPKPLQEKIFNEKLSKEFQQQYESRFGQSQAEQVLNSVNRSDGYTYYSGQNVTITEYQAQQRAFAEYMGRRLVEYHVDNWVKNDPELRPVYELKEKVSNVSVPLQKGYKFKWKYNFAGPNMEMKLENPYDIETRVRYEMTGILSAPTEVIYSLGYQVTQKVHLGFYHKQEDGLFQVTTSRPLTGRWNTSLTLSTDTKDAGPTVKQDLILLGFSWSG